MAEYCSYDSLLSWVNVGCLTNYMPWIAPTYSNYVHLCMGSCIFNLYKAILLYIKTFNKVSKFVLLFPPSLLSPFQLLQSMIPLLYASNSSIVLAIRCLSLGSLCRKQNICKSQHEEDIETAGFQGSFSPGSCYIILG